MAETPLAARPPYSEPRQQHDAAMMGMYLFLGSEIMLFGGIFAVAAVIRILHPADIVESSRALHYLIGALNTGVLLTSSFFVASAVEATKGGRRRAGATWLAAAAVAGLVFLVVKGYEYGAEYREGLLPLPGADTQFRTAPQHLFMNLYVLATGLHAIHLLIGIVLLSVLAPCLAFGKVRLPDRGILIIAAALYWHLVDVIWVFIYPVFYLAR
ncbi:cytochrome c oxidase subunit 3 [Mycoplana dimorpha]|uniref:Cytochrome c oxidase subunit 3 n=1 Tax=Mycoplana dimorpha TaxID=28320 RepID=A0A2T5AJP6_MYCDI|nr:cytochrome c oxidase subunit 3 [Mycoplana dimorpha]PTM86964.1 cytochrome c oxidase subunit 3 [Mycoplana dimorpha]